MIIRDERPEDFAVVRSIVEAAFGRRDEADLVDALRRGGDLAISLIALEEGAVAGHICLSRMQSPAGSLGLGPVAVVPDRQGHGIGSTLIRAALEKAEQQDCGLVFVLGEPDYYSRFGFSTDTAANFRCVYAGPYFMAARLIAGAQECGEAVYAEAFSRLA